ncbi:LysE/ArgO family amino acid transporter [Neisseria zalophi]|uniref:Amino acid transporter n=1 Tax=Neisseria zalophi TaxID=640030 RepID=A0A5J6Q005_9NEIS|nr:LysE/ArgO family amino acid transporter [Neisseria zalophi]QEY26397.1 amino acid transporter [Neisseria zalophi]
MNPFFNGLMISSGLIIAIGAQNAFVLKKGLLKQHIGAIVLTCWLCDVFLISCGVFGVSALLSDSPKISALLALAGGIFLLVYGLMNLKRAWQGGGHMSIQAGQSQPSSIIKSIAATLAITLLNPHVYIDTVVLIGGYANHLNQHDKFLFLIGALLASGVWFFSLGYGARLLLPLFQRERVWQILDTAIAVMMFYLAFGLFKQVLTLFG